MTRTCAIRLEELEWRFSASGGPGGQHANTANTRAEVRFDVAGSPSLGPRQRSRLLERLGPTVRVVPPRHPTSPTRQARERRLEDKRRRGELKRQRQLGTVRELRDER